MVLEVLIHHGFIIIIIIIIIGKKLKNSKI